VGLVRVHANYEKGSILYKETFRRAPMLSSAIPKRLVVSLVLVGLVSLFMTSFAGLTSERVSAQATGTDLKGLNFGTTTTVQAGDVIVITADP
ncbi:uncharacterized protein METZ01_LOCUS458459, partial [marine metagenome]